MPEIVTHQVHEVRRHRFLQNMYHGGREDVDTPPDYNTVLEREKGEEDLPKYEEAMGVRL